VSFILAALYAGVVSVDRFAALNLMLSRPIVVAFVMGLIFGNQAECFYIGLVFEAIGIIDVPFGTRIPKEDSFGAFAACALFAVLPIEHSDEYVLGFILATLFMFPVTYTCTISRSINKHLYLNQLKRERVSTGFLLSAGVMVAFIRGVVVYSGGTFLVYVLYNFTQGHLESQSNLFLFVLMVFTFLSGYILRFLTVKSFVKYAVFACGLASGLVLL